MKQPEGRFIIRTRDLYWRPDRMGYTSNVLEAGVYNSEEAHEIERLRPPQDYAVPLDYELCRIRVTPEILKRLNELEALKEESQA